ncbi:uncharacterized protein LOC109922390 [Rhincodon typus]|uniref:uncharacterized protein LOC109922390 n=1 Tax=Rhincodon typus TaxID=259920 RepID=UPI00202E0037|nr:uncharacterized protein LOC109922390 [Rhincodon typus]
MEDPTAGNWTSDTSPQTTESAGAMQSPNVPAVPNSPKSQHLTFNPVVQERQVQLEVQTAAPEPVATTTPHFTRIAPSVPQQSPQQVRKTSVPTSAEGRKVEGKTHHILQEATRIPVAVQVNSTTSTASSEMWILRRELKALGATQILVGIIQLIFGVPLSVSLVYSVAGRSGVAFWTGIWYIISGSFTVELKRKPTRFITSTFSLTIALLLFTVLEMAIAVIIVFYNYKSLYHFQNAYTALVKVVFASNVISAVMAGLGIIAYSMSLYYPLVYYDFYHGARRPMAPVSFVILLQLFTVTELVMAIACAMIIGRNLFRCCNLNSVSVMSSILDACSPSNLLRNDRRRLRHFGVSRFPPSLCYIYLQHFSVQSWNQSPLTLVLSPIEALSSQSKD